MPCVCPECVPDVLPDIHADELLLRFDALNRNADRLRRQVEEVEAERARLLAELRQAQALGVWP